MNLIFLNIRINRSTNNKNLFKIKYLAFKVRKCANVIPDAKHRQQYLNLNF